MTDTSDCESDAGASPSVSSDETMDSSSSRSSSPGLKIASDTSSASQKKNQAASGSLGLGINPQSPSVSKRPKKKQNSSLIDAENAEIVSKSSSPHDGCQTDTNKLAIPTRKRKRVTLSCTSPEALHLLDLTLSPESKRKRNKRRRTRSERNIRAGKAGTAVETSNIVEEGVESVALDAEIDRVLEEKAIKNNLSATNVKSIIRHVITNNMVQKMIMSAMKKKAETIDGSGGGGSSDEDGLVEPKMTRAKTKELLGTRQTPLWPIVDSPVKMKKQPMSETHMLIQHDLPEDSSGDEEYVPIEAEIVQSEDEGGSITSVPSDTGSPAVPQRVSTRRSVLADKSPPCSSLFKTPPPRPKCMKKEDSAISRRTRSKLPLNDTPLEDLERQLIPPDITTDMYDWGETDNEDYLAFLKEFLFPGQNNANEVGDDDEADPEYNVMDDDEDLHDREELRRDRAVKVPKKELNELVAELIEEYHVSSADELEDHNDFSSLASVTPFVMNDSGIYSDGHGTESAGFTCKGNPASVTAEIDYLKPTDIEVEISAPTTPAVVISSESVGNTHNSSLHLQPPQPNTSEIVSELAHNSGGTCISTAVSTVDSIDAGVNTKAANNPTINEELFRPSDLRFLRHQIQRHIQLLAQSYVLTVSSEDTGLKDIAQMCKKMITELKNFANYNGVNSNYAVCNLGAAWHLVNFWPHKFLQQSPIKKKILEEKYIIECGVEEGKSKVHHFPRHVVKIITENPTFLYNDLLPESYSQRNTDARCKFTLGEDMLIASSIQQLKALDAKASASDMAHVIADVLLVVHPQIQVFHRIRNLRKSGKGGKAQYCHPDVKQYFREGTLPEPDRSIPEVINTPLIRRDRTGLSTLWNSLLNMIEVSSTYKWEDQLNRNPVTKSFSQKWIKSRSNRRDSSTAKVPSTASSINRVFPNGTVELQSLQKTDPNLQAIPIMNSNGKPAAVIYIPKYAFNSTQEIMNVRILQPEPALGQKTGKEAFGQPVLGQSPTLVGLNHLIRRTRTTSLKSSQYNSSTTETVDTYNCNSVQNDRKNLVNLTVLNSPGSARVPISVVHPRSVRSRSLIENNFNDSKLLTDDKRLGDHKEHEKKESLANSHMNDTTSSNGIEEDTDVDLSDEEDFLENDEVYEESELITICSDTDDGEAKDGGGEGQTKSDSSKQKTSDTSYNCSRQENSASSSNLTIASTARKTPIRSGAGKGDESDEDNERRPRKRSLPKDAKEDGTGKEEEHKNLEKDKHNQAKRQALSSKSSSGSHQPSAKANNSVVASNVRSQKKARRSPGSQGTKRVSKYNVTPAEKMLQEDSNDFSDVVDAYMEAYLAKVHSATEAKHPGVYTAFVQTLIEAGDQPLNQKELHVKVKGLFKEYPELLKEFESFMDPVLCETEEMSSSLVGGLSVHDETMSQIKFIEQLEKFTENCPQLKAKIMNKVKSLKENPNLNEKDMVVALEPFFLGNPVMMNSFKALFPSIYRPHTVSSTMDFEEIDLEMEDPPRDGDDLRFEIVKLPDETAVPATNTCPCSCHCNTTDLAFVNRSKHCRNCSLKFQDGKIFIHNGRVMRPVSVELTPVAAKPGSSSSASTGRVSTVSAHDKSRKEVSLVKAKEVKEFKEPAEVPKQGASIEKKIHSQSQQVHVTTTNIVTVSSVSKDGNAVDEECLDERKNKSDDTGESRKPKPQRQCQSTKSIISKSEVEEWTEEEDTIILTTCQQEPLLQVAWKKMSTFLPHRSLEQIKGRCSELIALIQSVNEDVPPE